MSEASQGRLPLVSCDVCVIGGGSAGLSVAAGAAQLGASVVLIERGAMGGDCLNTGCVPSKSLIAAAHAAHAFQFGNGLGVGTGDMAPVDFQKVHDHIHGVIASIAPIDSVERYESMGVRVIKETARFASPDQVVAGGKRVRARRFVVATGSRAAIPPVPGLAEIDPLTNETIFSLTECPGHLLIVGGGPIGLETAQAFRRLGAAVTIVERGTILPRDEPEAAAIVRKSLAREGVDLHEHTNLLAARKAGAAVEIDIDQAGQVRTVTGTHILVAAGRTPNVDGLGLAEAGVEYGPRGIKVDARLRSSNRKIFAIGDIAGGPQFTHIAGYHAGIFVRNALFGLPAKADYKTLPWVTYLDPEVAHVGLTEAAAREQHKGVQSIVEHLSENDRAQTERRTEGFIKLVLSKRGHVLGVTIVAPHAGEMIGFWGLAIAGRIPLSAVAGMIIPYPTMSEISKRAAGTYFKPKLFSPISRMLVRAVQNVLP